MLVGITGAAGQLGYVTRARLERHHGHQVRAADRATFADAAALDAFVGGCDAIVHLAGVNRAPDAEIEAGNPALAQAVVDACQRTGSRPAIVYSSSIHRDRDTVYGRSKARAADILAGFAAAADAPFCEMVFPHLFGEFTRPNYNSFVGIFCHQVAAGEAPGVHNDAPVELVHYVDAADLIHEALVSRSTGQVRPRGAPTSVGAVARMLSDFHADYSKGVFPDLRDPLALRLFNAYRSVVYPAMYPFKLTRHADHRGSFFECVRERNGGQTSYSTTVPGITRGNHFHFFKVERFLVVSGSARISVRKLYSDQTIDFDVSGDEPCFVDMPTFHLHNITNTGDSELLTLFWTHDLFDPANPDTYAEAV